MGNVVTVAPSGVRASHESRNSDNDNRFEISVGMSALLGSKRLPDPFRTLAVIRRWSRAIDQVAKEQTDTTDEKYFLFVKPCPPGRRAR